MTAQPEVCAKKSWGEGTPTGQDSGVTVSSPSGITTERWLLPKKGSRVSGERGGGYGGKKGELRGRRGGAVGSAVVPDRAAGSWIFVMGSSKNLPTVACGRIITSELLRDPERILMVERVSHKPSTLLGGNT